LSFTIFKLLGNGSIAVLHRPIDLYVVSSSGNIYVADSTNQRVLRWLPGGDPATGGGLVASNTLGTPYGIVVTADEQTLYVADTSKLNIK
ncbi:unnamed protein product, partial [Didymodactylos carnosus]